MTYKDILARIRPHTGHWHLYALPAMALVVLTLTLLLCTPLGRQVLALGGLTTASSHTDAPWQHGMKDEDRQIIVAPPVPHQTELISATTFPKLYRGDVSKKQIALTFDDGPHPESTARLLAVLKQYDVKATFFLVGELAEKYPETVTEVTADGHCVANHTYHHDRLTTVEKQALAPEVERCTEALKKITGKETRFFRPPGGTFDVQVTDMAQALGYQIILWSINAGDYHRPAAAVIESRVLRAADNGAIVLFHDNVQSTVDALPKIITRLRAKGYTFVTIDEMLK